MKIIKTKQCPKVINHAYCHGFFTLNSTLLLISLLFVSGCIPTVTRVYLTPNVKGTVVDVSSLQGVSDILLTQKYDNETLASTLSTEAGKFELPAYSEIQGAMMMVGHSKKNYHLVATLNDINYYHIYRATSVMYYEDTVINETVFVDSEPSVIAPPPRLMDKTMQQWETTIESSVFAECNLPLGKQALKQLAVARKALMKGNSAFSGLAYNQVSMAWREYTYSCKNKTLYNDDLQKLSQEMKSEISAYVTYYDSIYDTTSSN